MSIKDIVGRITVAVAINAIVAASASAATATPPVRIQALQAGWVADRMLVFPNPGALLNPDGCTIVTNGYIMNENDPGRHTFYAMLLAAQLEARQVSFVLDGCYFSRPRIVSVTIY